MQTSGATNCIEVLLATAQMRWGPPAHGAPQLQPSGWMRQVLGALLVSSGACVLMHFFAQPLLSVIFIFLLALGVWSHFAKGTCFLTFCPPCKYNLLPLQYQRSHKTFHTPFISKNCYKRKGAMSHMKSFEWVSLRFWLVVSSFKELMYFSSLMFLGFINLTWIHKLWVYVVVHPKWG